MERNQTPRWLAYSVPLQRLFVRIGVLPFLLVARVTRTEGTVSSA